MNVKFSVFAFLTAVVVAAPVMGQHQRKDVFGEWALFEAGTGPNKTCWIATADQSDIADRKRLTLMLSKIYNLPVQASFLMNERIFGKFDLVINGQKYKFNPGRKQAWSTKQNDPKIIKALAAAERKKTPVSIIFPKAEERPFRIAGFGRAYNEMLAACSK